jgi:hypothetical protein
MWANPSIVLGRHPTCVLDGPILAGCQNIMVHPVGACGAFAIESLLLRATLSSSTRGSLPTTLAGVSIFSAAPPDHKLYTPAQ